MIITHPGGLQSRVCDFLEKKTIFIFMASQVVPVVKNPPASAGDIRDAGLIPGSGRSPKGGHGNPFQYSCLENPHGLHMEPGRLQGHRVAKSGT